MIISSSIDIRQSASRSPHEASPHRHHRLALFRDKKESRDALDAKGYTFASAEVEYIASTDATLTDEESIQKMERLIDMLEENDDVQAVWHNWVPAE